jgi:hypothetical protein
LPKEVVEHLDHLLGAIRSLRRVKSTASANSTVTSGKPSVITPRSV